MKAKLPTWLHTALVVGMLSAALAACRPQPVNAPAPSNPVPTEYQALYSEMDDKLTEFSHLLTVQQGINFKPLTFAAELLPANGNRGETLLAEQTLEGVRVYLDALQALGAGGVKLTIPYPLLTPDYPRSSEYVAFYRQVAEIVRQRQMVLLVGAGILFTDPVFNQAEVDYHGLTLETFSKELRQHIEIILREIQPDYLTVLNEPDTISSITGLDINLENYASVLKQILNDLPRANTLLGAGAGNWNDLAYFEFVAKYQQLDYIDLHFYPLSRDFTLRAFETAEIARQNSKRLVIGEAWLYKAADDELGGASASQIISRDVFSFWAPLDQRYLTLLARFAQQNRVEFVSVFWSKFLFAYLDYQNMPAVISPGQLLEQANQAAAMEILAGNITGTGEVYRRLAER